MESKMTLIGYIACISFAAFCLTACSHNSPAERKIEAEVANETPLPQGAPMAAASREILLESRALTGRQKEQLRQLYTETAQKSENLRNELSKNQLVLMKSLVDPKAKDQEIDILKNKIVSLEKDRIQNFLSSLDKAKTILGRRDSQDERLYRTFVLEPLKLDTLP